MRNIHKKYSLTWGMVFHSKKFNLDITYSRRNRKKDKLSGETEKGQTFVSGKVTQFISNSANFVWGVKQRN